MNTLIILGLFIVLQVASNSFKSGKKLMLPGMLPAWQNMAKHTYL